VGRLSKRGLRLWVIGLQAVGFSLIILAIWLDEVMDVPHRVLGAPATPANLDECWFESSVTLLAAMACLIATSLVFRHIRYLEGFVSMCAACRKVRLNGNWVPVEEFLAYASAARVTHGLCPSCAEDFLTELRMDASRDPADGRGKA